MTDYNNNNKQSQSKTLSIQEKINKTIDDQNQKFLTEHEYKIKIYQETLTILASQELTLKAQREKYILEIELLKKKILESK